MRPLSLTVTLVLGVGSVRREKKQKERGRSDRFIFDFRSAAVAMARTNKKVTGAKSATTVVPTKRSRDIYTNPDNVVYIDVDEDTENPQTKRAKKSAGGRRPEKAKPVEEAFTAARCLSWFQSYATAPAAKTPRGEKSKASSNDSILDAEGMEKFYASVGIDPSDILALILSQRLGVSSMEATISQAQWMALMTSLSCDSDTKLRKQLPSFLKEYQSRAKLLRLCEYVFGLAKKPEEKAIAKEVAVELFSMMMKTTWPAYPTFCKFLQQSEVRGVTLDTFCGLCDVANKYPTVDILLKSYDSTSAFPSLADDFVAWLVTEVTSGEVTTGDVDESME
ncbi:putative DCN1-like protein 4 [Hypsibius exemplaris]|uniref:Defective in cullin neddylation protein n=1 Tax=Hypsibius exemplaris TaxID=2072580 RepID=A0A1W0X3X9_HYPEX|nr:putative DCN1-like protein 4 [Hypsibius exemplaris]